MVGKGWKGERKSHPKEISKLSSTREKGYRKTNKKMD
jgi:hypothetical protein